MLARRFTIVCLLTAAFGMGMSSLVAQSRQMPDRGLAASCALACPPAF